MRMMTVLCAVATLSGCENGSALSHLQPEDLAGRWYGLHSEGRVTSLSQIEFLPNGRFNSLYYTCISDQQEESWPEAGRWTLENNAFTLMYNAEGADNTSDSVYSVSYLVTYSAPDEIRYRMTDGLVKSWLKRKWSNEDYDCSTTAEDVDRDRQQAVNAVRDPTVRASSNDK